MNELKIDMEKYFAFDVPSGSLKYTSGDGMAVILPWAALQEFIGALPGGEARGVARGLGATVGKRFGRVMRGLYGGKGMEEDVDPSDFLTSLNGILALHGFGAVEMETWGDVIVCGWQHPPKTAGEATPLLEGMLGGVLAEFSGQPFEAVAVDAASGETRTRFLAGSALMIKGARSWLKEGASLGEIVGRLREGRHTSMA